MKKAVIWDLDGTLLDSYDVIVESLYQTFLEIGAKLSRDEIHQHTIRFSTKSLFAQVAEIHGVTLEQLQQRYSQISTGKYLEIKAMHHAVDILSALEKQKIENYVFTHRGRTTIPVLDNLGLTCFFKEILTSQSGFARKPNPEAILYLLEKHGLERQNTYYVGDRSLDMACAKNAGIQGILFLPQGSIDVSGGGEAHIINELMDLQTII